MTIMHLSDNRTMKRTALYILMALVLPFVSCQKDLVPDPDQQQDLEGIVLTLKCQEPERNTRAGTSGTKPGIAAWNENKLRVLDIYFYRQGATGSNAVKHVRHLSGADDRVTVPVNVTDAEIENIAPRATTNNFYVYVLANYPDTTALNNLTNTSLTHLKELTLNTDFVSNHLQNSFVMDGEVQASIESRTRRLVARAEVDLKRVAAKITVHINIPDTITVKHLVVAGGDTAEVIEHWKANTSEMKVYLVNGVRTAVVGATPQDNPTYFTYRGNMLTFSRSEAVVDTPYVWICDPMYMYPQHWEFGSETPPNMEPTLKLQLPWTRIAEHGLSAVKKQFYYKILVPNDARGGDYLRTFVRNNWYKFKIDIGILGSETDEASIDLTGHYYVEEWQDKEVVIKHAEIGHARYLSVEQDSLVLSNEPSVSVLYTSSHPVVLKDIVVTKPYYGNSNTYTDGTGSLSVRTDNAGTYYAAGTKYIQYDSTARAARNGGTDWLKVEGTHVIFSHTLDNEITSDSFDTSPYTISFTVIQKDQRNDANTAYQHRVTIVQRPAIYITSAKSNGKAFVNNSTATSGITDNSGNNIGSVVDPSGVNGSGDNNNQNQYTIYVSVLPAASSYMIGDPRTDGSTAIVTTLNNLNDSSIYRPTAENTQSVIAPAVKIASSYGKTNALWYENARTKCAAYQENGYPAGRWRLPTAAEIEFFVTLSEQGVIPSLFSPGDSGSRTYNGRSYYEYSYYWAGGYHAYGGDGFTDMNGRTEVSSNNQSYFFSTTHPYNNTTRTYNLHAVFTRCVYDVWYWGDEQDSAHMTTWGGYQTKK